MDQRVQYSRTFVKVALYNYVSCTKREETGHIIDEIKWSPARFSAEIFRTF